MRLHRQQKTKLIGGPKKRKKENEKTSDERGFDIRNENSTISFNQK